MGLGLTFHAPHPALRGHATLHYVLRGGGAPFETLFGAMLPQVQRVVAGACEVRCGDGPWRTLPRTVVTGPTNAAVRARGSAGFVLVGTGLRPAGWAALLHLSAAELADELTDAGALWGDALARAERLGDVEPDADDAQLARAADRALLRVLRRRGRAADPRIAAVDAWLAAPERARVDDLAGRLGLSARQVERLTAASHGGPPRLLLTKHRALRAGARLALGDARDWAAAADDAYSDQPHFIRSFRRFVGVTPGRYVRGGDAAMARAAFWGRARAGAADPLALWS